MNQFTLTITNKEKIIYLENLKGKIFKLLPLSEENNNIVPIIYLSGLLMNINSSNQMFNGILIDLLIQLNEITFVNSNHKQIRKIVLESLNMVSQLIDNIKKGE